MATDPTTKKSAGAGYFAIPEPVVSGLECPKCHAMNAAEGQHHIWRVADERGLHFECTCCFESWAD